MADENEKGQALGTRRFRLPKLFAEAEEAANEEFVTASGAEDESSEVAAAAAQDNAPTSAQEYAETDIEHYSTASAEGEVLEYVAGMAQELLNVRAKLDSIHQEIADLNARESTQEKVFNTLHTELSGYKNDFIYEHLKPVVRPLLFLYDSLEQFDGEVRMYEKPEGEERRGLSPRQVRENIVFFRDQLVEALRVCEVTRMETPEGIFNAKQQKAIGVEAVEAERANHIVRVVRSGWFLNGQLLRPAEVIVGKAKA
jgi:molecular chaperone GrpE (heat shock protein)